MMWLALVVGEGRQIVQVHCRLCGSALDCLTVYGIAFTNMFLFSYHESVRRNKST